MIREIIKDIIKKKSSKSDFESLVKNSNLESESIIEGSDYTSITSKQKERNRAMERGVCRQYQKKSEYCTLR